MFSKRFSRLKSFTLFSGALLPSLGPPTSASVVRSVGRAEAIVRLMSQRGIREHYLPNATQSYNFFPTFRNNPLCFIAYFRNHRTYPAHYQRFACFICYFATFRKKSVPRCSHSSWHTNYPYSTHYSPTNNPATTHHPTITHLMFTQCSPNAHPILTQCSPVTEPSFTRNGVITG